TRGLAAPPQDATASSITGSARCPSGGCQRIRLDDARRVIRVVAALLLLFPIRAPTRPLRGRGPRRVGRRDGPRRRARGRRRTMNREEVLAKLAAGEIRVEEAANLMKEAEPAKGGSLYCRVSEKGAVSVYGLQRMPVTLYVDQWERLLEFADEIRRFLKAHDAELKRKAR